MSDWMGVPNDQVELAAMLRRIENLERRAPAFTTPEPPLGCCTAYCCVEQPFDEFEVGEIVDLCDTTIDPVGGAGLRLEVSGWIRMHVVDAGQIMMRAWVDVDAIEYVGSPRWVMTLAAGDEWTMPIANTIDVSNPDPTVKVRVQNLNTPTIRVDQAYVRIGVTEQDGSDACGTPAGQ